MKIALLAPDLDGAGAQRVMLDLAAGLSEAGADVELVVVRAEGPLRTAIPPGVRLVDLGARRAATALPALARYFRRARPSAAVACLNHVNVITVLAAQLARTQTRVVVTQHNQLSTATRHKTTLRARLLPRFLAVPFRRADAIVAVSSGVADDLAVTLGIARAAIKVIYNPIDFARLRFAAQQPGDVDWPRGDGPRIVAAGRLTPQKDFATLLEAVALVPEVRLLVLGEGHEKARLDALVDQLGLADRVRLAGFVDNPFPAFAASDLFVLSSRWEGLPTVLIEALALAPRVVATDCPSGPREILDGGAFGHLVGVGDPAALAAAIRDALANPPVDAHPALVRYERSDVTRQYLDVIRGPGQGAD
jgi:glycosyltransferase involved in cell wall biosynthesis